MEIAKVDNLVSTDGEIFEGTQKWARFDVFCAHVKSHWPLNYGCIWSSWVVSKILFVAGDASIDGEYVILMC